MEKYHIQLCLKKTFRLFIQYYKIDVIEKIIKMKLIDTDNSVVVTRGKGSEGIIKSKSGQIYGDGQ